MNRIYGRIYFPSSLKNITVFIFLVMAFTVSAQSEKGKFIKASIGYGISAPYDDVDITGSGFYAQGEYVLNLTSWFGVRPYAGVILTGADEPEDKTLSEYKVTSNAFLFGGKIRLTAPIPWVAPYLEAGVGGL